MKQIRALADSVPDGLTIAPGLLVDLDGTVRNSDGYLRETGKQWIMEGRLPLFRLLKKRGWRIIGITNFRHTPGRSNTPNQDIVDAIQAETQRLCEGMFDDIFWPSDGMTRADDAEGVKKPAPTMLLKAIELWKLDPDGVIMVGNSDDDREAAKNANVPYSEGRTFFANPSITVELLDDILGHDKKADAAQFIPRSDSIVFGPDHEVDGPQVAVQDLENRRYKFPDFAVGRPAAYEHAVRFAPDTGVPDPGYHGYEYALHVGDAQDVPEGYRFVPAQHVLKNLYGGMGLAVNRPYRDLDRARVRVILRGLQARKKKQLPPAEPQIQLTPPPQVPDAAPQPPQL